MTLKAVKDIVHYHEILEKYYLKGGFTNDYIQNQADELIKKELLYEFCTEHNAFFFVKRPIGFRVYYHINDVHEQVIFSSKSPFVTEILYRGQDFFPQQEVDFFERCGFHSNLIRDQYAGVYKDLTAPHKNENIIIRFAQTFEEVAEACHLFNDSFDALSGDFIPDSEFQNLLDGKNILVATDSNGQFCGALHQTIERNVAWISHIAVVESARGQHVGQSLVDVFVETNKTTEKSRYMFWVQHQNEVAVKMYQKKGFNYIGKSTISLIIE